MGNDMRSMQDMFNGCPDTPPSRIYDEIHRQIHEKDLVIDHYRAVMEQAVEFIDTLEFADDDTECNNVITALREVLKEE